jgi:outer membrane protein OmpA-like peptidoglycan-associated protein
LKQIPAFWESVSYNNINSNFKLMKKTKMIMLVALTSVLAFSGCKSLTSTQKGAGIGTVAGGAAGAVIGRASGNTALGAVIGATVGGVTGAVIGHKMDKQAEELKKKVPDANVERVGEGIVVELNSNILFGFDSSSLSSEAKTNLDKMVTVFNTYPDTNIEVQGHTDSKGSNSYNYDLSVKRASSVSSYLTGRGIAQSRLTTRGYGENAPKYENNTENDRSLNRRVEFLITANDKMKAAAEKEAAGN